MQSFGWLRPRSVEEAAEALGNLEDPKLISGGMTLIPTLKQDLAAPSDLIDLGAVPGLAGISVEGDRLVIGAMTRHADVAASPIVREKILALAVLAGGIGDPAVRRRGTIGGSVANADPAADYPAGVLGLDAEVVTNERVIPADDFFVDLFETALGATEIVTAVRFRIPDQAHYIKFPHPVSGYAVVGLMVARLGNKVRVSVTGAGSHAFRVNEMEAALEASFKPEAVAGIIVDPDELMGDMHCSAGYRSHVLGVLAKRAVAAIASPRP
ncbi:MAG TPA: xanthine dehydrogenase family protein subunit M [Stellaceae bacterium]|nr:xanthine dehydrogenase family protein subunit M [Stellaceae bacterium]